jgi:hypothetical protein
MQRTKIGLAFAAALLVLAVTAIPAAAWFESSTASTSGIARSSGAAILEQASGGKFQCSKTEGAWKIRSSGKTSEQEKGPGQQPTKQGPHQDLFISKWEGCFAIAGTTAVPATAEPCELQLEQPEKLGTTGTASVASECRIKVVLAPEVECIIHFIPVSNQRLKTVNYSKSGPETVSSIANITGVVNTATEIDGGCMAAGIIAESGNKFKATTLDMGTRLV